MPDHHQYCTGGFSPDDIVITGIAGRLPECDSLEELKDGLLKQKKFLIPRNDRFEKGAADLPFSSTGILKHIDKFDADFFGMTVTAANNADPVQRILLEVSYEAIADAGYEPTTELRGAKIGVYTSITNEDSKEIIFGYGHLVSTSCSGHLRCMSANRVSHVFDFHGPSFTVDAACSSGLVALWAAFNDIKEGRVEAAVVNSGQLCLSPLLMKYFFHVGIISPTAESSPFDKRANGIVRSEAVVGLFLQKASAARRVYASIIEMQHQAAGYVPEGVYVPSFKQETLLFRDVMKTINLGPENFQFIEAHGTGTQVGDPIEIDAISEAFCRDREKPLYVGSVKSNLGHSEAAAGQCGTLKAIFAFETGLIAPNHDFQFPNPNCKAIMDGRIKVPTEPLSLITDYIPVNCFGFGGSIVQAVYKRNPIVYPSTSDPPDLPRLVLFPGTTEDAVLHLFEYIKKHPELRAEFFALVNKLSFPPLLLKPFRGFALFQDKNPVVQVKNSLRDKKREVWFVLTSMGCQWPGMGLDMMEIKVFADSMKKSAEVLKPLGLDLFELLKKDKMYLLTNRSITPAFVCIAAIQIALVDVLRALEIFPDGIIGHSTGEIACAYADGCCTAEQTLLSAYWRGKAVESVDLVAGEMAAVGLTWEEALQRCPKGVYPVCHNAKDSVTISGLKEPLEKFVAELQQENIFARIVNAYGYAFHCEHVWPASKGLRKALSDVIPKPQERSKRWISTSYPEDKWYLDDCKLAGPEYFVNNLMSTVRFYEVLDKIPTDALIIEIGPHFLLQSVLKRTIGPEAVYIGLMKNYENNIEFFLQSLGKLYLEGLNPKIENLYRPVKFPVPRGTPMICDLIKWDHSQSFHVPVWKPVTSSFTQKFQIDSVDSYLLDHFIDGRALFPATGYIYLAWTALAKKYQKSIEDIDVEIENFKIHRPTILSPTTMSFNVTILDSSGKFEIMQNNSLVATGKVNKVKTMKFIEPSPEIKKDDSSVYVSGTDIYNELRIHGYEYGPMFRKLVEVNLNGKEGFVEWNANWIPFMDALLLFYMFSHGRSSFLLPTSIHSFKICPQILKSGVDESLKKGLPGLPVNFHANSKICRTVGLEIRNLSVDVAPQQIKPDNCIFEVYKFIPYVHKYVTSEKYLELEKYKIACNKIIDAFENKLKQKTHRGKFSVEQQIDFDVQNFIKTSENGYRLLKTLKEVVDVKGDITHKATKDIFHSFFNNIGKDFVNTLLFNDYCLRLMFDIIAENSYRKTNILEINNNFAAILPTVVEVVEKYSMLKFKNRLFACKNLDDLNKDKFSECNIQLCQLDALPSAVQEKSQGVVISAICISTIDAAREHLHLLSTFIAQNGFILLFHKNSILPPENLLASISGEGISVVPQSVLEQMFQEENLLIISKISDGICGSLYLLKHAATSTKRTIIRLSKSTTWLDELREAVCGTEAISCVVSEECPTSGIIGMINCLRHEPGGDKIRCVFMLEQNKDNTTPHQFNFDDPFFQDVLKKDLVMNVYKNGMWGSYRHIRTKEEVPKVEVEYSYVNVKKYGDLSSLTWMESVLQYHEVPDNQFVHIYYSAINFKDIMIATGKLSLQTESEVTGPDKCVLGLEYSGRSKYGERVAGICGTRGLATATKIIPELCFVVPDEWTLEEAATVPIVYITCYYALIVRANLEPEESILIHSGTGGVGQAAIRIALSMNCEVYTTVGTEEKKQFLLKTFPEIKPQNIGYSRDTSFEQMITDRTNGRGVDVVLNSLADEKFLASIRCVAANGRFVEIGKYDLAMDRNIGLKFFLNNISFHAVVLDPIVCASKRYLSKRLMGLLRDGIKAGVVKPLNRTVFQRDEVEKAFRYMGTGTHIGKILIKIRDEENEKFAIPSNLRLPAIPITYFYSHKVYIIIGGLGGFGIEVANWILDKGAKHLILTTRYGARTPYHHFCLKRWKDEGYNVIVSTRNVSKKEEASKLLEEAKEIGLVGGIFNSAVVLHDAFLENTDWEKFKEVCAPKADATENLDILSRELCPELDHFVCFSSISCGRGNAGQMNYGYANSVMERICEKRKAEGYPGLTIQWGIIGEVGVVHRHMGDDAMIAGVGAQRVKSCLRILDLSCQLKEPVVCSYVVADPSKKIGELGDPLQQLARIFGLKDPSEFNPVRTLGEMGVDSMAAIEVKHLLESTCDASLTMQEIQEMKIDDIKTLIEKAETQRKKNSPSTTLVSTASATLPKSFYHPQAVQPLNNIQNGSPVFIVDIDCYDLSPLRILAMSIKLPVYVLLLTKDTPITDVETLAKWYLDKIHEITKKEWHIVSHSSSTVLAFEIIQQFQKMSRNILTVTILNGASSLVKLLEKETASDENDILCKFISQYMPSAIVRIKEEFSKMTSLEQKLRYVVELFTASSTQIVNKVELTEIILSHVKKVQLLEKYTPQQKLNKDLLILEDSSALLANDIAEVKNSLTELCSGKITIQRIPDLKNLNPEAIRKAVFILNNVF